MPNPHDPELILHARHSLEKRSELRRLHQRFMIIWFILMAGLFGLIAVQSLSPLTKILNSPTADVFLRGAGVGSGLTALAFVFLILTPMSVFFLFRRAERVWRMQELLVEYHDQLFSDRIRSF